eukprot:gene12162-2218_t
MAVSVASGDQAYTCNPSGWRNNSGCTTAGHYSNITVSGSAACCSACAADYACQAWTFHETEGQCDLADKARAKSGVPQATCGCKDPSCSSPPSPSPSPSPPSPPGPSTCVPVIRPPAPSPKPLPPGKKQPHFITVLVDDLGWDDTAIHNPNITFTPNLGTLASQGVVLTRHHTYKWCSPTRRSFLTGRYPSSITGGQAPTCSNLSPLQHPLQFTWLSEKLHAVGYESHFIGKGHLGYQTVDHLPQSRGFASHVGYLGGAEDYHWGGGSPKPLSGHHDMWHDQAPGVDVVPDIYYSTNFYAQQAVEKINTRNTSQPFWLHLTYQSVHAPYEAPPKWEMVPPSTEFRSPTYASMLAVADNGLGNITAALKAQGMWQDTLFVLTGDNGGDCGLLSGAASNYPLLGRKCTAFEGGTRTAAFVSGGLVPQSLRGTSTDVLMHVADWYPTMCNLGGVDPADDWKDPSTGIVHPIDGLNVWPAILAGSNANTSSVRQWLPTTEDSILYDDRQGHMWKLIVTEHKANRFHSNGSQDSAIAQLNRTPPLPDSPAVEVPPSCAVCSQAKPCLYDVISDPFETSNVASISANAQ